MPKAKEWCDAEKKALALLLTEHEPRSPAEWQALAAQMPTLEGYPFRSGKSVQNMAGREELREALE